MTSPIFTDETAFGSYNSHSSKSYRSGCPGRLCLSRSSYLRFHHCCHQKSPDWRNFRSAPVMGNSVPIISTMVHLVLVRPADITAYAPAGCHILIGLKLLYFCYRFYPTFHFHQPFFPYGPSLRDEPAKPLCCLYFTSLRKVWQASVRIRYCIILYFFMRSTLRLPISRLSLALFPPVFRISFT